MPIRIGFGKFRQSLLHEELDRIGELLPQFGVTRAILLNSLEQVEPDASLRLVLVKDDERPFVRRLDFFYSHVSPRVAVEFFSYTPDEFDDIMAGDSILSRIIQRGQVIL